MKSWTTREGRQAGGKPIAKNSLYNLLTNMIYVGLPQSMEGAF